MGVGAAWLQGADIVHEFPFVGRIDVLSWGHVTREAQRVARPRFRDELPSLIGDEGAASKLAVGLRRSYGDSCLNGSGALIDMCGIDRRALSRQGWTHAVRDVSAFVPKMAATCEGPSNQFGFLAQGGAVRAKAQRIVILGAASAIAEATGRIWAAERARMILVGRDAARLESIAADLETRGAEGATPWPLDCANADADAQLGKMVEVLGGLDVLLLAYGVLGNEAELEHDPKAVATLIQTNFTSAVAWCLAARAILEKQGAGALLVIGSVAGDRGRRSNFIYGATKGGLARLVEGMAHQLARAGRARCIDKARFRRYANDHQLQEQGTAVGSARASGAGDRGGRPTRRTNRLRAGLLATHHADRPAPADFYF
jgi:decaprenylphospho-beta-D-erythro-pentofuranosid-2-ulose 2-reductase